jgi:hypothetical protein
MVLRQYSAIVFDESPDAWFELHIYLHIFQETLVLKRQNHLFRKQLN